MKTLIEIHALQNFAPSNLNRDDTGAPKDALFGGFRRARISSQCVKRSIRQHFSGLVKSGALRVDDLASRTKRVLDLAVKSLEEKGRDPIEAGRRVESALGAMELSVKDDGKTEYLLFLGRREIASVVDTINANWDSLPTENPGEGDGEKSSKAKKKAAKKANPALRKALEELFDGGRALDVALFGRMLADMPKANQDAACQVAHAISTHVVDREFDFYTAVDDLKPEDTAGADMMGTVEFNSACFYRYAVVDWEKLVQNLQGDQDLAATGLRAFLEGFVVGEPSGKQNSFAAHNPPEFVVVSVRRNTAPRNLANAFESAVRVASQESLTSKSAQVLVNKAKALRAAYGGEETSLVLNLVGADISEPWYSTDSLEELLSGVDSLIRE